MLRIMGFNEPEVVGGKGVQILVESDEFAAGQEEAVDIRYLLVIGLLENYMELYKSPAGVCLTAMLLDAFYDDIEIPHWQLPDAPEQVDAIAAMAGERMEWHCDRNALLSLVTIDQDDPESVAGTWIAHRQKGIERGQAFLKMQEERLADEYITAMPDAQRSLPRDLTPVEANGNVGLGIEFVP